MYDANGPVTSDPKAKKIRGFNVLFVMVFGVTGEAHKFVIAEEF